MEKHGLTTLGKVAGELTRIRRQHKMELDRHRF